MKKKGIVITVIGILLILLILLIVKNSNKSKTFRENGVLLALTVDGVNQTTFPSRGNYKIDIDCKNGKGKWLVDEWKFVVEEITGNVTCNVSFTTKTNVDNLLTKITNMKGNTSGTGKIVDEGNIIIDNSTFTSPVKLEKSAYSNLVNDASYAWTWDSTNKTWTSINHTDRTTSEISFTPSSNGDYQICYKQVSEKCCDYTKVYKDNTEIISLKGISNTDYECKYLGSLTTSNKIKVTYQKDGSSSTDPDNVVFYIQKGTYYENIQTYYVGVRYEGQNPNNYIWFNNEMWRIIGVIPVKNASGTSENLIKIIRNESLGGYAYYTKYSGYTGAWGSSTLYTLLNSYYWGKKDGTSSAYCYGHGNISKSKCDYRANGIMNTDYYGSMVREVYWNTGASVMDVTASAAYTSEQSKQTVKGYVGLMNASDFGYATSGSHTTTMDNYDNATNSLGNWLYANGREWSITQDSSTTDSTLCVDDAGDLRRCYVGYGYGARPVFYLDSKVYVVSGDGSEANPYIIAKEV